MSTKNKVENVQPLRTTYEIEQMREALGQTNQASRNLLLFNFGINTGLRISDIISLRVEDVKGKTSFIIKEGKTQKPRKIYLNSLLAQLTDYINDDLNGADTGYLFPSRKGDSHISRVQAYRIVANSGKACGYDYVGTHTMRKTFGYFFYKQTKDIAMLMDIFNHSSQDVTRRYIGITEEEKENALQSFAL